MPFLTSQQSRLLGRKAAAGNGLLANLIGYWGFDEAAGANNALDKHSGGLTLTQNASPGSASGLVYAGARTVNGSTQYFNRASEAALNVGNNDATFAIWLYPTSFAAYGVPVSKWADGTTCWLWQINQTTGTLSILLSANGSATTYQQTTSAALSLNQWSLVALTYDYTANVVKLYINNGANTLPATQPSSAGIFAGSAPFRVGAYTSSVLAYTGRIGPFAMWKSAPGAGGVLDATKLTALYNAGAGLTYAAFTA